MTEHNTNILLVQLKFIYSEKATTFCEISTLLLSYVVSVKSMVEISQNVVAFSEFMNFIFWLEGWERFPLKVGTIETPIETGDRLGSSWFSISRERDRFENSVSGSHISLSPVFFA